MNRTELSKLPIEDVINIALDNSIILNEEDTKKDILDKMFGDFTQVYDPVSHIVTDFLPVEDTLNLYSTSKNYQSNQSNQGKWGDFSKRDFLDYSKIAESVPVEKRTGPYYEKLVQIQNYDRLTPQEKYKTLYSVHKQVEQMFKTEASNLQDDKEWEQAVKNLKFSVRGDELYGEINYILHRSVGLLDRYLWIPEMKDIMSRRTIFDLEVVEKPDKYQVYLTVKLLMSFHQYSEIYLQHKCHKPEDFFIP